MKELRPRELVCAALLLAAACAAPRAVPQSPNAESPASAAPRPILQPSPLASVILPDGSTPLVSLRLVFRAGAVDDPPGKEGLTALTTNLLVHGGTRELSSAQLIRALYPMAAELSAQTEHELTTLHGRVHRDHLARFLRIFTDTVTAPRFDPQEFTRLRDDALNELRTELRGVSDEALSQAALDSLRYQNHPYRHPEEGTVQGLLSLTLDDVKTQWKRLYTQDRLVVGLAGAVDAGLEQELKTALRALPLQGAAPLALPPSPAQGGRVLVLEKQDALSTAIAFGHPYSLRRGDPDYFAVAFGLSALGEHRQVHGILFRELREHRGLNYGTYAYVEHFAEAPGGTYPEVDLVQAQQDVTVWIRPVKPEHAIFATRAALFFLTKLIREPLSVEIFRRTRGFLLTYTRLWEQTDARRLGYALDALYDGKPHFLEAYRTAIAELTPETVRAAIARHVHPERLSFAFVAPDGQALAHALGANAPSPITYESAKPKELLEADAVISRLPLPIRPQEIRVEPAREFMER